MSPNSPPPPRRRQAVLTWLAIYPTVTAVSAIYDAAGLTDIALPVRTLALTVVVVPVAVFILVPALTRMLGRWLGASRAAT